MSKKKKGSPGVAPLGDFLSRGIKDIVVLAGTLLPLHTASSAILQQAFRAHAARCAPLTGLRGQATMHSVSRVEESGSYFLFNLVFMSIDGCALTQSLSWIWQLSWHSTPAVPGLALVQLK